MGARRYGPDTGRFLQRNFLSGALGDLALALDPLAQGRYTWPVVILSASWTGMATSS
jgi:hypothetical protein